MKKKSTLPNNNLCSLFNGYEALAHSSTSLPHQYPADYHKKLNISTTLLTPNGLGIRPYTQYHKSYNFGIERRIRPARKILFIFSSHHWHQCYPNQYHACTDTVRPSQLRSWSISHFTSPDSDEIPASICTLYCDFIRSLINSDTIPPSIITTNRKINANTSKVFLKNLTRAVFSARRMDSFQHFSLGYSEIIIQRPQTPRAIFIPVVCNATRLIGFVSTILLNHSVNATLSHSLLDCPCIPLLIPHHETIKRYSYADFLTDLSQLRFNNTISLDHWKKDIATLKKSDQFGIVIHQLQQKVRLHTLRATQSPPLISDELHFLYFSLKLHCKFEIFNTIPDTIYLLPHHHLFELIRLAIEFKNSEFLNTLLLKLQFSNLIQPDFFITRCTYNLFFMLQHACQLSPTLKNTKTAYLNPTAHQLIAFFIHLLPMPDNLSIPLLHENAINTYGTHPAHQPQWCCFSYYRRRAQWNSIAKQLQPILNDSIQVKKILCLQLLSMSSINAVTLFIYSALGMGLFFNSTHFNHTVKPEPDISPISAPQSQHVNTRFSFSLSASTVLPSLTDAKQAAQLYLDQYLTPASSPQQHESKQSHALSFRSSA